MLIGPPIINYGPDGVFRSVYKVHFFSSLFSTAVSADRIKLNKNAQRTPSTLIPETNLSASNTIITLITKRKRPNVIIVRGMVKIISKGLTIKLRTAKTRAKIMAVLNVSMATWGANSIVSR